MKAIKAVLFWAMLSVLAIFFLFGVESLWVDAARYLKCRMRGANIWACVTR